PLQPYFDVCFRLVRLTDDDVNRSAFRRLDPGVVEGPGDVAFEHERRRRVDVDVNGVGVGEHVVPRARRPELRDVDGALHAQLSHDALLRRNRRYAWG